jgi:flagellar biosynthesis protein FlhB
VSGARTERPTPKRLAEARRRGEVAVSRELTGAAGLVAGLALVAASTPWWFSALAGELRGGLAAALRPDQPTGAALHLAALAVLRLSAPPLLATLAAALVVGLLQTGGLLSTASLAPRLDRLDPVRGLGRVLSGARLATLGLGLLKAALVMALVAASWRSAAASLAQLPRSVAPERVAAAMLWPLAGRLGALLLGFGALDLLMVRLRHQRRLRMSRDEVRRELREQEGDPAHRAERRRAHRALAEAAPLARATCLVVNPTHVAVALHHRRGDGEAPRVLAKGTGAAAARLRALARRAGVPIVRDPPLARALHRLAEVGDEIPEELYDAAAAVLAHLHGAPPPESA